MKFSQTTASVVNNSALQFIVTNGLASDAGIVKVVSSPYDFTIPVGIEGKNTSVTLNETDAAGGSGEITIIPVNQKHPFANNNITDELQFYWIIDASASITPQKLTHTYTFDANDTLPNATGFVAARFNDNQWEPDGGDESLTSVAGGNITFTEKNYIKGEYTAGTTSNFTLLETYYLRDNAPLIASGAAWRNLETWSIASHADNLIINRPNSLPNRNTVIIKEGHKVEVYDNGIRLSKLRLYGELNLNATEEHDFGSITGTGTLVLKNNASNHFVLPNANISGFIAADSGTIVYDGTGYLPNISNYNQIKLIGDGNKNMPNTNLNINGNLTIESGVLSNDYNTNITIKGNWTDNSTSAGFVAGNGTVTFSGSQPQMIAAPNAVKTFYNLVIANGSDLTISNKAKVTAAGHTTISGVLNLTSSSLGTTSFIDNGITQTGTAKVQRRIRDEVWHYIGLPVTVVNRSQFNKTNFWYFNEAASDSWNSTSFITDDKGWVKPADGNLVANYGEARGFAYMYHGSVINFSGILNSGNKSAALSYTNTGLGDQFDGWNLLANPYPSALNWDNVDKTNIEAAVYYYQDATQGTPEAANYATYIDEFTFTNGGKALVPQMQGFFVKAKNTANGQTFALNNSMRAHPENNATFYKSNKNEKQWNLKLSAISGDLFDETLIRFKEGATDKHDADFDAYKLFSKSQNIPQIYSLETRKVMQSINTLPTFDEETIIPLGIRVTEAGEYEIKVVEFDFPTNTDVYLYDSQNKTYTLLEQNKSYKTNIEAGNHINRFSIRFSTQAIDNETDENNVNIYTSEGTLFVNIDLFDEVQGEIKIIDLAGKVIYTRNIYNQYYFEIPVNLPQSVYLVQVVYNQKVSSKKVFIQSN